MNVLHVSKEVQEFNEGLFYSKCGKAAAFEAAGYRCRDCIHFLQVGAVVNHNCDRCTAFAFGVSRGAPYDFAYTYDGNGPCPLFRTSFVTYCCSE